MSITESERFQFGPWPDVSETAGRRSLLGDPSRLGSTYSSPCDITDAMIAEKHRRDRHSDVKCLLRPFTYGYNSKTCSKQKNTCIWSGGAHSWTDTFSCEIMWVAVHGMDSICVATRIKDLEYEISLRYAMLKEKPECLLRGFNHGLIGQVEDFVDPSSRPRRKLHQFIKKPFGVVSVIPDTKIVRTLSAHKALSAEYDEENAIKFLQNEMESGVAFTYEKTVQTAIRALDHLFRHEFKANEIQVFVLKEGGGEAEALPHIREDLDIEENLAAINGKPDSCVREEDDLDIEEQGRRVWVDTLEESIARACREGQYL